MATRTTLVGSIREGWRLPIRYEKPGTRDAAAMWQLARNTSGLDLNSPYYYLFLADKFSDTCILAKSDNSVIGFIAGLRPPSSPDTLFVWQITVADSHRGKGIAHKMLRALLSRLVDDGAYYLDASVTPSNVASQRMFRTFAERIGVPYEESLLYPAELFPDGEQHEEERLLHIGPFTADAIREDTELVQGGRIQ